jgi:purine-binding chemotaxis protein CheW
MKRSTVNEGLFAREQALWEYFDSLFREAVSENEHCTPYKMTVDGEQISQAPPVADRLTDDRTDPQYDERLETAVVQGSTGSPKATTTDPVGAATHMETTPPIDAKSSMMAPSAAEADNMLDGAVDSGTTGNSVPLYLKFRTAGLNLAIPLEKVAGEITWSSDIVPVAESPAWLLGQRQYDDRTVQIIDTAMFIIPKARRDAMPSASRSRYQHIIVIGNGRWGLACEKRDGQIALDTKEVNWRTEQGTRPWLAGTLTKDRCALLDAEAMGKLLDSGQWPEW